MTEENLVTYIKDLRLAKGITQKQIADHLGISVRTYQRIEQKNAGLRFQQFLQVLELVDPHLVKHLVQYFNDESKFPMDFTPNPKLEVAKSIKHNLADNIMSQMVSDLDVIKNTLKNDETPVENIGYWEWNITEQTFFWSDEMYEIYQFEKGIQISHDMVTQKIDSRDIPEMNIALNRLFEENIPMQNEHRIIRCDGSLLPVISCARKYKLTENEIIFGITYPR